MARTPQTASRSTGGHAPKRDLNPKKPRGKQVVNAGSSSTSTQAVTKSSNKGKRKRIGAGAAKKRRKSAAVAEEEVEEEDEQDHEDEDQTTAGKRNKRFRKTNFDSDDEEQEVSQEEDKDQEEGSEENDEEVQGVQSSVSCTGKGPRKKKGGKSAPGDSVVSGRDGKAIFDLVALVESRDFDRYPYKEKTIDYAAKCMNAFIEFGCLLGTRENANPTSSMPRIPVYSFADLKRVSGFQEPLPFKGGLPVNGFEERLVSHATQYVIKKTLGFVSPEQQKRVLQRMNEESKKEWGNCCCASVNFCREVAAQVERLGVAIIHVVSETAKNGKKISPSHSVVVVVEKESVTLFQPHFEGFKWPQVTLPLLANLAAKYTRNLFVTNGRQTITHDCSYHCLDFIRFYAALSPNNGFPRCQARKYNTAIVDGNYPMKARNRFSKFQDTKGYSKVWSEFDEAIQQLLLEKDASYEDSNDGTFPGV
ncbi:hypothetical protein BDR26DRAFT_918956 [Obelidium mucronatum]|nr:hypothetical protein BDR26DRAFT_918956 [Obelidium mucronatum]